MRFPIPNAKINSWVLLLVSFSISLFFSPSLSDPRIAFADQMCEHSYVAEDGIFPNFDSVMENLSKKIRQKKWGMYSITNPSPPVFGLAQCHKDLSEIDCQLCFAEARTNLPRCLPNSGGRIYLEGCFIRYENYDFYTESVNEILDSHLCSRTNRMLQGRSEEEGFGDRVGLAVLTVMQAASVSKKGGFGVAEVMSGKPGAFALGQCWNTMNSTGCASCLEDAWRNVGTCLPAAEGRAFNAGCYLRYSTRKFFESGVALKKGDDWPWIIEAAVVGCASVVLALFGVYIGYNRFSKRKDGPAKLSRVPSVVKKSNLNYKYEVLEQATDFFNSSNKLGQGGSSSVWKHYKAGNIAQVLESNILNGDDFQEKEASNVLQIGLLCTQSSPSLRPSMSEVVQMLTVKGSEIPSPKQPPFLNASVLAPTGSSKLTSSSSSSAMDTTNSDWHRAIDVSELMSRTSVDSDETTVIQTCEPR
ncbi:hypothetical protein Vadar_026573 [Vaccinium darrowii]|uniref:Uncharacterized protein n=1 Tax=Vaccinium darrowii TaxID=229202 RepID=A0ACB7ZLQ8_9ERIC|nr:hypothetical protein Vadar_026573 [Vaccinium darrowii]